MASATPSRTLPKSTFHKSVASTASENKASAAAPRPAYDYTAASHEGAGSDLSDPSFTHPDHVIPPRSYTGVECLVIVCCHAIFHPDAESSSFPLQSPYDESNWHLAPFQTSNVETGKPSEHETFLAHIAAGLDALTTGSCAHNSILVFSGGITKASLTSLSEARSYYHAALALGLAQGQYAGRPAKTLYDEGRILLEEHAADSFQNLLFSIILFRQTTGVYPKEIRIITHAFKAKRFLDLHASAIRWPPNRISVQGIDPIMSREDLEATTRGEERFGYLPWQQDNLGTGEILNEKRKARGWQESMSEELGHGLEDRVRQLLNGKVTENLPWSDSTVDEAAAASEGD